MVIFTILNHKNQNSLIFSQVSILLFVDLVLLFGSFPISYRQNIYIFLGLYFGKLSKNMNGEIKIYAFSQVFNLAYLLPHCILRRHATNLQAYMERAFKMRKYIREILNHMRY